MTSTTKVNKGSGKLSSRRFKTMLIEIIMILVTAVVLYPLSYYDFCFSEVHERSVDKS